MRIYNKENVYDKAFQRMEWVFREFKGHVFVNSSGGKDSTSTMEIAVDVMNKLKDEGTLPQSYKLKVMWLDQEAEWTRTREYIERLFEREELEVYWMQLEFQLRSNTDVSNDVNMLDVFNPDYEGEFCQPLSELAYDRLYVNEDGTPMKLEELNKHRKLVDGRWVYDKELDYKEHNQRDFYVIFKDIQSWLFNGNSFAAIQGLKGSESMARNLQVRYSTGYKGITWSSRAGLNNEGVIFSPIYDWSNTDNFVQFEKYDLDYNEMYDEFLQMGMAPGKMRISSLIHETSVAHYLPTLQELDRGLYDRMVNRLSGVSTYSQIQEDAQKVTLPVAFSDYEEYARYLIDNVLVESNRKYFLRMFEGKFYKKHEDDVYIKNQMDKAIVQCVLTKDVEGTKWENAQQAIGMRLFNEKDN